MTPSNNPDYEPIVIPISHAGAYLYQAPHHLKLTLDKQLAVVFCLRNSPSTGLVLSSTELSIKDLLSELELLYLKIKSKLNIHTSDISLKIFGLSHGATHVLESVHTWANTLSISVKVTEIGRRLIRNLLIDCRTGKVEITYGDLHARESNLIFLSEGTARNRIPLSEIHNRILILTHNRVQRQLTRAAIEEYPAWAAVTAEDIQEFIRSKPWQKNQWSVVLCFEDLVSEKGIEGLLNNIHQAHPGTQLRWVGADLPEFAATMPELKLLPPMDYQLLPDFKKMLKRAVFDANLAMSFQPAKLSIKKRKSK